MSTIGSAARSVSGPQSGTSGSEPRERTIYERESERLLKQRNVEVGRAVMAEKPGSGHEGDVEVQTNVYALNMGPLNIFRYDVCIVGERSGERAGVLFTKKYKDDAIAVNRRDCCRDVILSFMRVHSDLAAHARCLYNDLQSIMYTMLPLAAEPNDPNKPIDLEFEYPIDQMPNPQIFTDLHVVKIRIYFKPWRDDRGNSLVKLEDLSTLRPDIALGNRDLLQFLDIATSQEIFFHKTDGQYEHVHFSTGLSYAYYPEQFGFTGEDALTFEENNTYLALGCSKSTHLIEGSTRGRGSNCAAGLLVQPKKTPFHANCSLLDKVKALVGNDFGMERGRMVQSLNNGVKGLFVQTNHNADNIQRFPIKGLERKGANEVKIEVDGGSSTIEQYFLSKYNRQLLFPNLPLVAMNSRFANEKRVNYYPIEVLDIIDNQRVTTQQQTSSMVQQSIKKCAVTPFILKRQVHNTARSIHLWDSEYLEKAGVRLTTEPITLRAHQLNNPEVKAGDGAPQRPSVGHAAAWRINSVLVPQSLFVDGSYSWMVACFQSGGGGRGALREADLRNFLNMLEQQGKNRGIRLPSLPGDHLKMVDFRGKEDILTVFQQASQKGVAFMLCIHGDNDDLAHHFIKKCERDCQVISQCVKAGTVRNVVNKQQRLTVDNILNKTNVKLGGINYTLPRSRIATSTDMLIIGISTNHPGGGIGERSLDDAEIGRSETLSVVSEESTITGPPSVVGYAANVGPTKLPFDFVGDFMYQRARREEKVNIIESIIGKCVNYFNEVRGDKPRRVVLYRNGCSEGQFKMILKYEVPLIKCALEATGCVNATLTLIVSNKLQNMRFFNKNIQGNAKPPDQNIQPGTVIDTAVVHPTNCEFFLNSHRTLQGTARTPKYTVLYDDNKFDLTELEDMSYHLCFGHQIISSIVSLPAPVYIANEYAKRGRNLYNQYEAPANMETFGMLNESLCLEYAGWIAPHRVNA
uniref:Piwi domain-containing protein n=1 Tax=Globodera rostochiensis TaxID=31243 RepID=A0A914HVZ9_GLORO